MLTQLEETSSVTAADIAVSYQVNQQLNVSVTAETYDYDDNFKLSYTSAPIEERITLAGDYAINHWDLNASLTWFGARDLTDYGYEAFNRVNASGEVINSSEKTTDAPDFFTLDVKVQRHIGEHASVYFGASNLLDYTQAGNEESPLMFDADAGYDVAYIYGPLRGREAYVGFKLSY